MVANIRWARNHRTLRYLDNSTGEVVSYEEIKKWEGDPLVIVRDDGRIVNPVCLDMNSANAFITVYEALSPANKKHMTSVTVAWACEKAWQVIEKVKKP